MPDCKKRKNNKNGVGPATDSQLASLQTASGEASQIFFSKRCHIYSIIVRETGKTRVVGTLLLDFDNSCAKVITIPKKRLLRFPCSSLKEAHAAIRKSI